MGFLIRLLANALAILAAAYILPGIEVSGGLSLLAAALVLALINAFIRPILLFLTLPFTLVTLGLFIFLLNAFCLWLTSQLVKGFEVHGFWTAVLGALLISIVSWAVTALLSDRGHVVVITRRRGDVIDITPKN
jgi:putative membrane protein